MIRCVKALGLLFILLLAPKVAAHSVHVRIVTEDAFPIQYMENGMISGPATKLVQQVLDKSGLDYTIELFPWARAYHLAKTEPNTLIYSLAKTDIRADQFKWVGEIMALEYYFYGHKDLAIDQTTPINDLKQYRIGTVRDSAVYQYLQKNGFEKLTTVVHGRQNYNLFKQQRIDLFPANKSSFKSACQQKSYDCSALKPLYKLAFSSLELYMAFSLQTDDAVVKQVRDAYQQIMAQQKNN